MLQLFQFYSSFFQTDCGNLLRLRCDVNFPFKFQKNMYWFFWKNRWNRLSLTRLFSEHGQLHQKIEFFVSCRWTSKFECMHGKFVVVIWDDLDPNLLWLRRRFSFFTVGGQSACMRVRKSHCRWKIDNFSSKKLSRSHRKMKKKTSELHRHHFLNHF